MSALTLLIGSFSEDVLLVAFDTVLGMTVSRFDE